MNGVSVVIPTRSRVELLLECLDSLSRLPDAPVEVIVVDDGSPATDRRRLSEGIERIQTKLPARAVFQGHAGPNAARNRGIAEAAGDAIILLDDDVVVPRHWLQQLVAALERYPGQSCVGGPLKPRYLGTPPRQCGREPAEASFDPKEPEGPTRHVLSANMGFRRETFEAVGPFIEGVRIGGDETEWEVRLQQRGGSVVFVPGAWVLHQRTKEDLSVRRILAARFHRGRNFAANAPFFRRRVSVIGGLAHSLPPLVHAVVFLCWGGLFNFTFGLGAVWETMIRVLSGKAGDWYRWLP